MSSSARLRFRQRAQAWLTLAGSAPGAVARRFHIPELDPDPVTIAASATFPDGSVFEDTLILAGDLQCGRDCRFTRPVYAGGQAGIGRGSHAAALSVEGSLTLGPGVQVDGWAESGGRLDLRSAAKVVGEAGSLTAIEVGLGARAASLHAPEVGFQSGSVEPWEEGRVSGHIEIAAPAAGRIPDLSVVRGWKPARLTALDGETWFYDGDLQLPSPLLLKAKLVVRGGLWCPPGSLLDGEVRTGGWLEVGAGSLCRANLAALGDLTLDEGSLFSGNLRSGGQLRLGAGTRGFRESAGVRVSAAGRVVCEPGVVVRGSILSESGEVRAAEAEAGPGLELLLARA